MIYSLGVLTLCSVLLLMTSPAYPAIEERLIHQTFSLNPGGTITLSNVDGDVIIQAWTGNRVDVKATKRGEAKDLDRVEIIVNATPKHIHIETDYPRHSNNIDVSVQYELMVPENAILETIRNVNGDIDVLGVEASIKASTVNGKVKIEGSKSSVEANTVNGKVSVTWAEFPKHGRVDMSTVNGKVKLYLPEKTNATVEATSMNGSIHCDFPITVKKGFLSNKLNGTIGAGGTIIDLTTINGSIDIVKAAGSL